MSSKTRFPCWAQALLTPGAAAWVATPRPSVDKAKKSRRALAIVISSSDRRALKGWVNDMVDVWIGGNIKILAYLGSTT